MNHAVKWDSPRDPWYPSVGERIAAQAAVAPNVQRADYTLQAADAHRLVEIDSTDAVTVTVPAGVFTAGQICVIVQTGPGHVSLAAGAGLTLNTPSTLVSGGRWATVAVMFRGPMSAIVAGNLTSR